MAEVTIYINGRSYDISCDNGQEGRIVDLASYIDQRLQQISRAGAAYNDAHLMVLTSLVLADELFDARSGQGEVPASALRATRGAPVPAAAPQSSISKEEEQAVLNVLEQITKRIEGVASRVLQAS
ncbi:MAG: cell division protein ZapA [Alphaproteobacteria bacterium]|nr:cell division protein ZapA [Alphaproteobacteria bacterium]MDE2337032.1 cell division protein ZapA [Alphaproteobacteria bacterium]